eukprot:scaffold112541_cov50-Prasinocladus_malaysianus.AAC.2
MANNWLSTLLRRRCGADRKEATDLLEHCQLAALVMGMLARLQARLLDDNAQLNSNALDIPEPIMWLSYPPGRPATEKEHRFFSLDKHLMDVLNRGITDVSSRSAIHAWLWNVNNYGRTVPLHLATSDVYEYVVCTVATSDTSR